MYSRSSKEQTADKKIFTGPCALTGIHAISNASDDMSVIVHDGTDTSGDVIAEVAVDASVDPTKYVGFPHPVECLVGLYANVAGTAASYIIEFKEV